MPDWGQYLLRDSYFSIAQGQVGGYSVVNVSGYNPDIDIADSETVWSAGGLYPWSVWDTARTLSVVSTSAADQGSVIVSGLDANFLPITEEINCAGVTPTSGTLLFKRVYSCLYKNGATNNAGAVSVKANSITIGLIEIGVGQSLNGIYTVPAGYTAYMLTGDFSVHKGKDAQIRFFIRPFGESFRVVHIGEAYQSTYRYDFAAPVKLTEKTDLDIQATFAETNNTPVSTNFSMILVDNNAIQ
jgi:hypothetical protein